MSEINRPQKSENNSLNIYSAVLTFRKTKQGTKSVSVHIRYSEIGNPRIKKLPFPEEIKNDDLCWTGYQGEQISVYHRQKRYKYLDLKHCLVQTDLGQSLERLVFEVHNRGTKD